MFERIKNAIKWLFEEEALRTAIRNGTIVAIYTLFSSIVLLDALTIRTILISLATGGLVFATELANYYKVDISKVPTPKRKINNPNENIKQYKPFFNLWV